MAEELKIHLKYINLSYILENNQYSYVNNSKIVEAGLGLFAKENIPKDTIICIYRGDILRTQDALRLSDKSYLMRLGEQCYVDARNDYSILARYINDCRNQNCYNVRFLKCPSEYCAYVITTRDIDKNEEFYVDYGKWYWVGKTPKKLIAVNRFC